MMSYLPTILLTLAITCIGATVNSIIIARRAAREARNTIFPVIREEETYKARWANISSVFFTGLAVFFFGGWLVYLLGPLSLNSIGGVSENPAESVEVAQVAPDAPTENPTSPPLMTESGQAEQPSTTSSELPANGSNQANPSTDTNGELPANGSNQANPSTDTNGELPANGSNQANPSTADTGNEFSANESNQTTANSALPTADPINSGGVTNSALPTSEPVEPGGVTQSELPTEVIPTATPALPTMTPTPQPTSVTVQEVLSNNNNGVGVTNLPTVTRTPTTGPSPTPSRTPTVVVVNITSATATATPINSSATGQGNSSLDSLLTKPLTTTQQFTPIVPTPIRNNTGSSQAVELETIAKLTTLPVEDTMVAYLPTNAEGKITAASLNVQTQSSVSFGPISFSTNPKTEASSTLFDSTVTKVYATYPFSRMENGAVFKTQWYLNDKPLWSDESVWQWGEEAVSYTYINNSGNGIYRLELYVNNGFVVDASFEITE